VTTRKSLQGSKLRDADAIRREAAILRDLLAATLPPFERSRQELRLEPDAPPLVAAFWETMGWSELFVSCLAHPERERGAVVARKLLSEFVRDGGTELRVRNLPQKFRLVEVDTQGVGFMVTDETDSSPDPRVLAVASEASELVHVSSSYLQHVSAQLSKMVFRRWYSLRFAPVGSERLPGEPALPLLCPNLRRISEDLWLPGQVQKSDPDRSFAVAFRTSAALVAWLSEHPHRPLGILSVQLVPAALSESQEAELLREIGAEPTRTADGWDTTGSLLGEPVLARSDRQEGLSLFVGRRERHALELRLQTGPPPSAFARELIRKLRPPDEPEVERAPALALSIDEHQRQARELADWVGELAPEHRDQREPIELPGDTPGAIAALWNALGASKIVKRGQFWPPDRVASQVAAAAALARWFEDSRTRDVWNVPPEPSLAPESWLPHPFRMVEVYVPRLAYDYLVPGSSYLDFADESSGALDPPIVRVRAGAPRPVVLSSSYVRYVSSLIAGTLAERGNAHASSTLFAAKGQQICAGWFEGLYRLAEGLWFWGPRSARVVNEHGADEAARLVPLFLFRDVRAYLEFCERLTLQELAAAGPPSGKSTFGLTKAKRFDPARFKAPGFRLVQRVPAGPHRWTEWAVSGRMSDAPVYLAVRTSGRSTAFNLYCADRDVAAVRAWLEAEGIGVAQRKS